MTRVVDMNITLVYVIDQSLGMSKGKIAAQVSHAAMMLGDQIDTLGRALVLKASHEQFNQLRDILHNTQTMIYVQDAGLTQVPTGTMTCIAFIQTPKNTELTSEMKLL